MRQWPDLRGLTTDTEFIVVGAKPSKSKRGRTRLVVMSPSGLLCDFLPWKYPVELTSRNIAILESALRTVVSDKAEVPFNRGSPYLQVLTGSDGPQAYLYESYRGTLFPRYKWELPYNMELVEAALYLLELECFHDDLQAVPDRRLPAQVEDRPYMQFNCHGTGVLLSWGRLTMRDQAVPTEMQEALRQATVVLHLPDDVKQVIGTRHITCTVTVQRQAKDS